MAYRDTHGRFKHRRQLLDVPRLGPKTFEQCAGFLRILDGDDPLDASSVHPEAYPVVQRILERAQRSARELIGNREVLRGLDAKAFTDQRFGEPTVRDILAELEKPGRDPRGDFVTASFHEGVEKIADLKPGMKLQGVVTNVANFGAFVDVGVHHDGLVHVSELADRFVKDPREVAKAGQLVSVTVLEVDVARKRIALSMKSGAQADRGGAAARTGAAPSGRGAAKPRHEQHDKARAGAAARTAAAPTALGDALARALRR